MAESFGVLLINGEGTGSDPWEFDSKTEEGGNTFDLSTDSALHGVNGYELVFAGSDPDCFADVAFTQQADTYLRSYIKIPSWVGSNNDTYDFYLCQDGSTSAFLIRLTYHSATTAFGVEAFIVRSGGWTTLYSAAASDILSVGTTYYLECRYLNGSTTGGGEIWIDNVSKGSDYTLDTSHYFIDGIEIGITAGSNPGATSTIYFDDIKVATSPIGAYQEENLAVRFTRGGLIDHKWFDFVEKK